MLHSHSIRERSQINANERFTQLYGRIPKAAISRKNAIPTLLPLDSQIKSAKPHPPMKKITVYTTTYCGYCQAAKSLLDNHNLGYHEIDVTNDAAKRQWLVQVTGQRTVPQIFIDDKPIGGYSDLNTMANKNQLS